MLCWIYNYLTKYGSFVLLVGLTMEPAFKWKTTVSSSSTMGRSPKPPVSVAWTTLRTRHLNSMLLSRKVRQFFSFLVGYYDGSRCIVLTRSLSSVIVLDAMKVPKVDLLGKCRRFHLIISFWSKELGDHTKESVWSNPLFFHSLGHSQGGLVSTMCFSSFFFFFVTPFFSKSKWLTRPPYISH